MTGTDKVNYIIYQKPLVIIVKHNSYHLISLGQCVTQNFLVLTPSLQICRLVEVNVHL